MLFGILYHFFEAPGAFRIRANTASTDCGIILRNMKVCFETFGCRLNRAEALEQEAEFAARGWIRTEGHADADIIVVRGCSVTQRAQHDCEHLIEHIRRKYPLKRLVVTGCLMDKTKAFTLRKREDGSPAPVPTRTARAYLKVQDGCSGKCTFCIVPKFRGAPVSVDFGEVLDKAKRFVDAGYREIVVTGCNLSLYESGGKRLPELVAALSDIAPASPGETKACRIRLGSVEPSAAAADVLDVMAERENVCRFLHIPIQSGSNRILALMGRPYAVRDIDTLVHNARQRVPGIAIGCDFITGFPGESDIDFIATKGILSRARFERVHVFPYSERPGTPASAMPGAVPLDVRRARAHELMRQADKIRSTAAREFEGNTVEIVVEDEKRGAGWTSEYFWCSSQNLRAPRKSLAKVKVRTVDGHMLSGEPA